MTISQAIAEADGIMPNHMPHPEKLRHLSTIEGRLRRELIDRCEGGPEEPFCPYEQRSDFDPHTELAIDAPYDEIYIYYLGAMIAHAEGEQTRYAECNAFFAATYTSLTIDYLRSHKPRSGGCFRY